jgi:hypothetical protein
VNFQTTNPAEFPDRQTQMQIAVQLDEANNFAVAEYTVAGAIALGGKAFLKTGAASAMTLAAPTPGAQNSGGQDGLRMSLVALDAFAYVVTAPADSINGADDTMTFGAAIGDSIELLAFGGLWYTIGTPKGVTLSEV